MDCYIFALLLVVQVSVISAQLTPCQNKWMTTDDTGAYYTTGEGDLCQPSMPNSCQGGPNAVCIFSFRTNTYRCCHDVWLAGATGLTKASDEGWAKPMCPYGARGYGSGGAQVLPCNLNSTTTSGRCPADYTCTRSVNQPPKPAGNAAAPIAPKPCKGAASCQAYLTPSLCCLTSTLTGNNLKSFALQGLTPNIVPQAPNGIVQELVFGTAAPIAVIRQGEDWSSQKSLFLTAYKPLGISPTVTGAAAGEVYLRGSYKLGATDKFHVLIFDATTNKDILLWNYDLTGTAGTPATPATATTDEVPEKPFKVTITALGTSVTPVAGVSTWAAAGYVGPASFTPQYTTKHLHVVLVFKTSGALVATIPTFIDSATGILAPTSAKGNFTTVTAFLTSAPGKALGAPIAGTYFYL
uniref:Uncharacterized protein n=1 Tax=Plectus sambesii TaxID=2011161 RepID=A0A914V319_9BILA